MQTNMADKILVYPQEVQKYREEFLKRRSIQEFQKISDSQIETEYKVLSSANFHNPDQTIWTKKTFKNRYIDILVYNHSRVTLQNSENFYLNASCMKSIIDGKDFAIFAQAPTPEAFSEFWQAVYEKHVGTIVMLCNFIDPKRGHQADKYWPDMGKQLNLHKANISLKVQKQENISQDFSITYFSLEGKDGKKQVKHMHWTGWSDLKKPLGEKSENLFRQIVNECIRVVEKNQMFLAHCSAGIGRTGTMGTVIEAIRCAKHYKQLSIFQIVENLRKHRMYCVQTFEQYRFIYQQLKRYFKTQKIN